MVKLFPRISRKETGEVTISDGKFKMEVKERWRFWVVVITFFGSIFMFTALVAPAILYLLTLVYLVMGGIRARVWRSVTWAKDKIWDGTTWVGKWVVKQPVNDYRYGRRKRKELEDSKVYAK